MSAFLVTDAHIDAILTFARVHQAHPYCETASRCLKLARMDDVNLAGTILLSENRRAMADRYGGSVEPFTYQFRQYSRILTPVEMLKALQCLAYQLAEPDNWEVTDAMRMIRQLESTASGALPGWREAQWGIPG